MKEGYGTARAASSGGLGFWITNLAGLVALAAGIMYSAASGSLGIPLAVVRDAVLHYDRTDQLHLVVMNLRLPRALAGAVIGTSFAVAGAVMQGVTRNPLADSGLMGLNAGAGFALSVSFAFFPGMAYSQILLFSFLGAAFGAALVHGIASLHPGGATPLRLVLAGAAVTALLTALSQGIAIYFNKAQNLMFWLSGGTAGSDWSQLKLLLPLFAASLLGALLLSRSISLLNLGGDVAQGLGLRTGIVKALASVTVLLLAGSSVSIVGVVGFIGLVVPHAARAVAGADYRRIIPTSAILGAVLMVYADICAKTLNPPAEIPVGAIVSLIGVPFFLYLARRERGRR